MVKKVKCIGSLGLNVKNVEDDDEVNITAGKESVVISSTGFESESLLLDVASNSSKPRASRLPLEGGGLPAASRFLTSSIWRSKRITKLSRRSLRLNSKNNSSCPLTITM